MRTFCAAWGIFSGLCLTIMLVCTLLQIWTTGQGERWGDTAGLAGAMCFISLIVAAAAWDLQKGREKRGKR